MAKEEVGVVIGLLPGSGQIVLTLERENNTYTLRTMGGMVQFSTDSAEHLLRILAEDLRYEVGADGDDGGDEDWYLEDECWEDENLDGEGDSDY